MRWFTACPTANGNPRIRKKPAPSSRLRLPRNRSMTDLKALRVSLASGNHLFAETLAFIAAHYEYQPQAFSNGP
ncbi:MAG TPA: type III effector, partial [Pseudomonas sp.]